MVQLYKRNGDYVGQYKSKGLAAMAARTKGLPHGWYTVIASA